MSKSVAIKLSRTHDRKQNHETKTIQNITRLHQAAHRDPEKAIMGFIQMTYGEFRQSEFYQQPLQWFRLTIERQDNLKAVVAQWEPSNMKWYYPEPFEGRKECGYCDDIWLGGITWKIKQVRPL